MVEALPLWKEIRLEDIRHVSLRPHAVQEEAKERFAIGYEAVLFLKKGAVENVRPESRPQPHVRIPSASADSIVPGLNLTNALFQAAAVALNDVRAKRPDLAGHPWRLVTFDNHLGRALAYSDRPWKWINVPKDAMPGRESLIEALASWERKPWVRNLDQRKSRERRLLAKWTRTLEDRLLLNQLGHLRKPRAKRPMEVRVEDFAALWDQVGYAGDRAPPVLEALVVHWRTHGFSHDDIAARLGIPKRTSYEAQSRWQKRVRDHNNRTLN